jgi:nucleoside 2-deoxyribosyltransferase
MNGKSPGRFYIAARKDRADEVDTVAAALSERGWQRTFKWSGQEPQAAADYTALAVAELDGVREADVLIVLLPGGYGTHVEIGAALALGKTVIIHAPDTQTLATPYPCVFHYHPRVTRLVSETIDISAVLAAAMLR